MINRAVLIAALFCFPGIISLAKADTSLWVTREYATSAQRIDEVMDFCSEHHIKNVFLQIRGRGDAFYESRFIAKSSMIQDADFDPLAYACTAAHQRNLKLHAWFNTYILYSSTQIPPPDDHVYNLFPEWTSMDINGFDDSSLSLNRYRNRNFEGCYLSPVHPKVNQYLFILIREIVDNYPIDGIHLDYIRFQNRDYGFNAAGRRAFRDETGIDPTAYMLDDPDVSKKIPDEMFFELYDTYRMDAVNALVKRVKSYLNRQLSPIQLSAAVKPQPNLAKEEFFQDWRHWLDESWVDFVVIMNYNTYDNYVKNIDFIYTSFDEKYLDKIHCGIGIWKLPPSEANREITYSNVMGFRNIAYFSYTTFLDNPDYVLEVK